MTGKHRLTGRRTRHVITKRRTVETVDVRTGQAHFLSDDAVTAGRRGHRDPHPEDPMTELEPLPTRCAQIRSDSRAAAPLTDEQLRTRLVPLAGSCSR